MRILLCLFLLFYSLNAIDFKKGWNFVGFDNSIDLSKDSVLSNNTNVKYIWKYINDSKMPTQGWHIYTTTSDLQKIADESNIPYTNTLIYYEGAWVYANKDFSYTPTAKTHSFKNSQIPINDGWNLLSAVDNSSITINDTVFSSDIAWVYRDGQWYSKFKNSELSQTFNKLTSIISNEAFWIYQKPDSTLIEKVSVVKSGQNSTTDTIINKECTSGGTAIYSGLDSNKNGMLDIEEYYTSNPVVICNGTNGTDGKDGINGTNGIDGKDGVTTIINNSTTNTTEENVSFPNATLSGTVLGYNSGLGKKILSKKVLYGTVGSNDKIMKLSKNSSTSITKPLINIDTSTLKPQEQLTNTVDININADGTFAVDSIPSAGDYSLIYTDTTTNKGVKIDEISLTPDENKQIDVSAVLSLGDVKLNIQSLSTNTNLSNAQILIRELDRELYTNTNGDVNITSIPQGTYSLLIQKDGYASKYMTFQSISGETTDLKTIFLNPKKGSVKGKVISSDLDTLENIVVYLKQSSGGTVSTLTDSSGAYTFDAVSVDSGYSIIANAHGFASNKLDNISVNESAITSVENISISKLTSSKNGSISGFARYADRDGLNHAGIIVAIEGTDYEAITSRDGSFILNNIPSGRYTINFIDSNYDTTTIKSKKIVAGDSTRLDDIILDRVKGTVTGNIKMDSKEDHTGIKVSIIGTSYFTYTDSLGDWSIDIPTGNYDGISISRDLYENKNISNTITVTQNGNYTVAPNIISRNSSSIEGIVTVSGQSDYSLATIALVGISDGAKGLTYSTTVKSDGSFDIQNLPFGEYSYAISYPDGIHEKVIGNFILDQSIDYYDFSTINLRTSYMQINNKALYTNTQTVTLTIGNSDAYYMQIVENGVTSAKENFVSQKEFTLSSGDGEKIVTVNLFDKDSNPIPSISEKIILDTTISASSFTLDGATKQGDTLKISLNLGESDAKVSVDIPTVGTNVKLFDNGIGGDTTANDGIYQRVIQINSVSEVNQKLTATVTDIAENTLQIQSDTALVLSTPPTIKSVQVASDISGGIMDISFITDEPTTTTVYYGYSSDNLSSSMTVSNTLSTNHSVQITGLSANSLVYFKIEANDGTNTSTLNSQGKLAPPIPQNISIQAGNEEVGLVWDTAVADGLIGYNIYRSDNDNPFVKINDTVITNSYYLDTDVQNDTSYSYKLVSIDSNNNESQYSDIITATPIVTLAGPTDIPLSVIDQNQIWLKSRSPYNITDNVKIKEDKTLILLAGVSINIKDDSQIVVNGNIKGYGTEDNNISITTNGSGSITDKLDIDYGYIKHIKIGSSSAQNSNFKNCQIEIYNKRIYANSIIDSTIDVNPVSSYYYSYLIYVNDTKNSKFTYFNEGTSYDFLASIINANYCEFDGGKSSVTNLNNSTIKNSNMFTVKYAYDNNFTNTKVSSSGNMKYNILDINSTASGNYLAYNYWGENNITSIGIRTGYSPSNSSSLYPIISTADLFTADYDSDGTPDYLDHDNDNDGYSDLQEDKESDPAYALIYNPLDHTSHPSTAKDNDYDGTSDEDDDDDDNDGLTDTEEINYMTNPYLADSDGDQATDGDEVAYKYDPLNKNNYPINRSLSDITLSSANSSEDGVVYISKENSYITLTNIDIADGTTVMIQKDTSLTIKDSNIIASKTDPIRLRSTGAGDGNLYLDSTTIAYANIKLALYDFNINSSSKVSYSDITGSLSSNYGTIENSFVSDSFNNYGLIHGCYLNESLRSRENGIVENSFSSSYIFNYAEVKDTILSELYLGDGGILENSIVYSYISISSSYYFNIINSDVNFYYYGNTYNIFFENSFISKQGSESFYDGLGTPEDQNGDGVAETVFKIGSTEYTVDGIKSPRSSKNFPDFVADPSVKQYFWDPTNVGCLWDKNDPDTFPE